MSDKQNRYNTNSKKGGKSGATTAVGRASTTRSAVSKMRQDVRKPGTASKKVATKEALGPQVSKKTRGERVARKPQVRTQAKAPTSASAEKALPTRASKKPRFSGQVLVPRRLMYLAIMGIVLLAFAVFLSWFVQYHSYGADADTQMAVFAASHFRILIYGALVIFLAMLLLATVLGSAWLGAAVSFVVAYLLAFVNRTKMQIRGEPFLPEELAMTPEVGEISSFVDPAAVNNVIVVVSVTIAVAIVMAILFKIVLRLKWWTGKVILIRLVMVVALSAGLVAMTRPVMGEVGAKERVDFLDTQFEEWDQIDNYEKNGFLLSFLYNAASRKMAEPEGYSEERIKEIADKYQSSAIKNESSSEAALSPKAGEVSIVNILSESFMDPASLDDIFAYRGGDAIPFTHSLMTEYPAGLMVSPSYGGGTANVEFEVLTGFSNFFLRSTPYVNTISQSGSFPSIVSTLNQVGYSSIAIHPYSGFMYKRHLVYKNLGFDAFYDDDAFTEAYPGEDLGTPTSPNVSDAATFRFALEKLMETDQKQFMHVITMQNHMPYVRHPAENPFHALNSELEQPASDIYLLSLKESDDAMRDFITELNDLDKKVIVAFWGDHLPVLFGDVVEDSDIRKYEVPFLLYANYELDGTLEEDLEVFGANYVSDFILTAAEIEKPAFYNLLEAVRDEYPYLTRGTYDGPDDISGVLREYELIQYDIMAGKRYAEKLGFFGGYN